MAKKIEVGKEISEIKKAIEAGAVLFGRETTLKSLKQGKLKKIFLAKNCVANDKADAE